MDIESIIREHIKNVIDGRQMESLSEYADRLTEGLSENFTFDRVLESVLEGKNIFSSGEVIGSLKDLFLTEIRSALAVGIEILVICIISGLLKNLSGQFGKKSVASLSALVCAAAVTGLVLTNFSGIYRLAADSMKTIAYTMEIILPVLIGILVSMGKAASGAVMSSVILTSVTVFETVIKNFVMPAVFFSAVLALINSLTEKDYVNLLSKFIRNTALFVTGIIITLMSGLIAIQGLIVKTSDNLLIGIAKYSLDSFIPIVGGFTADTVELFLKCMTSIKNVVGIFGIIMIIVLILTPIVKIAAVAAVYKITALAAEPVASKKLSKTLSDLGTAAITMGAVLFFASLLFIIFITSILNIGGAV